MTDQTPALATSSQPALFDDLSRIAEGAKVMADTIARLAGVS